MLDNKLSIDVTLRHGIKADFLDVIMAMGGKVLLNLTSTNPKHGIDAITAALKSAILQ